MPQITYNQATVILKEAYKRKKNQIGKLKKDIRTFVRNAQHDLETQQKEEENTNLQNLESRLTKE
ncbi:MAG: hypothetical protein UT55_C0016G0007 [Candidatus Peregrinibacteria bacterium GW2011_GWE2_39_6]|nr:MAG: hypothetical protein UT36_C0003G0113 [Candidatus Peregrinibacteria bacterium GW2011_GWF2_39_17]KKR26146.1 MAG: hypothetical protein UT55_C0016G0007 [Candidatus Peregrinibacteria bacterium GW2011_GWE2_39_6]HCW32336.1 hypothetical protein [Candidatus Peregrinibacteria bacterium]